MNKTLTQKDRLSGLRGSEIIPGVCSLTDENAVHKTAGLTWQRLSSMLVEQEKVGSISSNHKFSAHIINKYFLHPIKCKKLTKSHVC